LNGVFAAAATIEAPGNGYRRHSSIGKSMIVWLASYPRTGNTFLRTVLHSVFGARTTSMPLEPNDTPLAEVIGNYDPGTTDLAALTADPQTHFVKTHEVPLDDNPAIYIIRDGRAAIASYWHFLRGPGNYKAELSDLIMGRVGYGSWSRHVEAWCSGRQAKTLLLQFDDLTANTQLVIPKIAEFCGLEAKADRILTFEELHGKAPDHFRSGSSKDWKNVFTDEDEDLFWTMHGSVMERYGFGGGSRIVPSAIRSLERIYGDLIEAKTSSVTTQCFEELQTRLLGLETDCRDRLHANNRLAAELALVRDDRQELLECNNRLAAELALVRDGRQELLECNNRLAAETEAVRKDRQEMLKANERLAAELKVFQTDREEMLGANGRLAAELEVFRKDREAMLGVNGRLEEENHRLASEITTLKAELESRRSVFDRLFRRAA
jgi:hypothetical protein